MIVYGHISRICLHANEGCKSKTKDSVYIDIIRISTFGALSEGKKCILYMGKYGIL